MSLSESSWKLSLSRYDLAALLRGDVRSLDVVFVVLVRVVVASISSPESLPTGLSLRSRAIVNYERYEILAMGGSSRQAKSFHGAYND